MGQDALAAAPVRGPAQTVAVISDRRAVAVPETAGTASPPELSGAAPAAAGQDDAAGGLPGQAQEMAGREIDRGQASWYGRRFHGRRTASGEIFNMNAMTAAHKTLPLGSRVRVRSLRTGKEVQVRINDRGPHVRGRIIDLSRSAASALGILHSGEASVVVLALDDTR
jgi:rare lipoprotein A